MHVRPCVRQRFNPVIDAWDRFSRSAGGSIVFPVREGFLPVSQPFESKPWVNHLLPNLMSTDQTFAVAIARSCMLVADAHADVPKSWDTQNHGCCLSWSRTIEKQKHTSGCFQLDSEAGFDRSLDCSGLSRLSDIHHFVGFSPHARHEGGPFDWSRGTSWGVFHLHGPDNPCSWHLARLHPAVSLLHFEVEGIVDTVEKVSGKSWGLKLRDSVKIFSALSTSEARKESFRRIEKYPVSWSRVEGELIIFDGWKSRRLPLEPATPRKWPRNEFGTAAATRSSHVISRFCGWSTLNMTKVSSRRLHILQKKFSIWRLWQSIRTLEPGGVQADVLHSPSMSQVDQSQLKQGSLAQADIWKIISSFLIKQFLENMCCWPCLNPRASRWYYYDSTNLLKQNDVASSRGLAFA